MSAPHELFDAVVGASDPAMVVVSAADGDELDACLVGFHCQCSIDPLRYAIWLSKRNRTHDLARRSPVLGLHWLADDQLDLAARVGTVSLDQDPAKMSRVPTHAHPSGAALLDEAATAAAVLVVGTHDDGDHECFVVEPLAVERRRAARPLRLSAVSHLRAGHDA